MIHASLLHSKIRQRIALLVGVIALLGIGYTMENNGYYVRTSVGNSQSAAPSPDSALLRYSAEEFAFQHPANWEPISTKSGNNNTTTVGPISITIHADTDQLQTNTIASQLGLSAQDLYTFSGTLGNSKGQYWAKGIRNDQQGAAPQGPRLYVTKNGPDLLTILIPSPPYNAGTTAIIDSFRIK